MSNTAAKKLNVRKIAVIGIMSALSSVLMMLSFPVGLPNVSMDFSEVPALFTSFMYGPVPGVFVVLIKNLVNLTLSKTMGVGELSNFLIGCSYVFTAGLIYSRKKTKKSVMVGIFSGAGVMAVVSVFTNYFIVFPAFLAMFSGKGMTMDKIVAMYTKIFPFVNSLMDAILIVHMPFTLIKGLICAFIVMLTYKRLSPLIRGKEG